MRPWLFRPLFRLLCLLAALPAACAAPPLVFYTLGGPAIGEQPGPLPSRAVVIEVARISLPDYLDTSDIMWRRGAILETSRARWGTRLSLGATDLLTELLAARRPDALVTDQPRLGGGAYRLLVNISRLDVSAGGAAALDADWQIIPPDPVQPIQRGRAQFTIAGPAASDADVVSLYEKLLEPLAGAIDIAVPR
jgi:uncharacterized lipoprotein YmbA